MEIRVIELLNEIKTLILGKVNERRLTIREVSEYAQLLVGFTYVDPVTPSKDYDFFKKNFQNSLLNKIRQLEKQLKVFGDLS